MQGISIVILACGEEENLRHVIPDIVHHMDAIQYSYEIIVVDTNVPLDETSKVCELYDARYLNQIEPGFGGALKMGIQNARFSRLMTIDADGAHPPSAIPDIVKMHDSGKYDIVIGSRYVAGGGTNDPRINVMMSRLLNWTYRVAFGITARDVSTNFRIYYTEDISDIILECRNYDVLQEILIKLKKKKEGIRIGETPIVLRERISGESKRKLVEFMVGYVKTLVRLKRMHY